MKDALDHPKRRGEWAELHFLACAADFGLQLSKPYGDSAPYDFIVEHHGRLPRIQVKCTSSRARLDCASAFTCNIIRRTGHRYGPDDLNFFAIWLCPKNIWYIIPAAAVTTKSIALDPSVHRNKYRRFREAWDLLTSPPLPLHGCVLQHALASQRSPFAHSQEVGPAEPLTCDNTCSQPLSCGPKVRSMTEPCQRTHHLGFRALMVKHQYKVMFASIVMGLIWIGVYNLLADSWFLSRLSLLLAIISLAPAGFVVLAHGRELGPFLWWDKSNVVLTTRRPRNVERLELTVVAVLWGAIFVAVVVAIFWR